MKTNYKIFSIAIFSLLWFNCREKSSPEVDMPVVPEQHSGGEKLGEFTYPFQEDVYVPIYSEIYNKSRGSLFHLTATLSIRNTSLGDTLFVKKVDYYDTNGTFIRSHLAKPTFVRPLGTLDYVIKERDTLGGSGAKFIISWGANELIEPIFQSVMIGTFNQQAFSFAVDGITIPPKE